MGVGERRVRVQALEALRDLLAQPPLRGLVDVAGEEVADISALAKGAGRCEGAPGARPRLLLATGGGGGW